MSTGIDTLSHKMQRTAAAAIIDLALNHAGKDREKAYHQMVDLARQFWGEDFTQESYEKAQAMFSDPNNTWVSYTNRVRDETDPNVARFHALNLGSESFSGVTRMIRKTGQ